jgi:hypothetical protein
VIRALMILPIAAAPDSLLREKCALRKSEMARAADRLPTISVWMRVGPGCMKRVFKYQYCF